MSQSKIQKFTRYFFLLVYLGFFCSITFFKHTHIIDGIKIVHSHPYSSDHKGNPDHSHSTNGFIIINVLNFIVLIPAAIFFLEALIASFRNIQLSRTEIIISKNKPLLNKLRGPPSV